MVDELTIVIPSLAKMSLSLGGIFLHFHECKKYTYEGQAGYSIPPIISIISY